MSMSETISQHSTLIVSMLALFVSVLAISTSWFSLGIQRMHYRKTLMPIIFIEPYDYENRILVRIKNEGTGPAIVKRVVVKNGAGMEKPCIFKWLPPKLPGRMNYKEYWTRSEDFVLRSGSIDHMLEVPVDSGEEYQVNQRDKIREVLSHLTVYVEYFDIYDNVMPVYSRSLKLFGRNDHEN